MTKRYSTFYYPSTPPVVGDSDAGLMALGSEWSSGSAMPTEYIDFLKIQAIKLDYSKGAVLSNLGAVNATGINDKIELMDTVYLYMPQQLAASYGVSYNPVAMGVAGVMATKGLGTSGTQIVSEIQAAASDASPEALFNTISTGLSGLSKTVGVAYQGNGSALSAVSQGKIFNPFEEMIFQGVSFRSHPFSWKLVARNEKEANSIIDIIKFFKVNMLPSFDNNSVQPGQASEQTSSSTSTTPSGGTTNAQAAGQTPFGTGTGARYLTVPNRFRISIVRVNYNANGYTQGYELGDSIYKFKDSILESMNVSYTPDNQYVSTTQGKVPAVQLDLAFKETAYVTAEDANQGY